MDIKKYQLQSRCFPFRPGYVRCCPLAPYVPLPEMGSANVPDLKPDIFLCPPRTTDVSPPICQNGVWIMTFRTVAAQTAMSKGRNICHCDLLSRQDSRKDQIKYSYFGMHDASWKSQYRSAVCIIGQKEHSSRKHRRTISNDFTSRISNGRWCQIIRIHRHTACTKDHISTLIQPVFVA